MNCPDCDHPESKVQDSRAVEGGVRRRRRCRKCQHRWTTLEIIVDFSQKVGPGRGRSASAQVMEINHLRQSLVRLRDGLSDIHKAVEAALNRPRKPPTDGH